MLLPLLLHSSNTDMLICQATYLIYSFFQLFLGLIWQMEGDETSLIITKRQALEVCPGPVSQGCWHVLEFGRKLHLAEFYKRLWAPKVPEFFPRGVMLVQSSWITVIIDNSILLTKTCLLDCHDDGQCPVWHSLENTSTLTYSKNAPQVSWVMYLQKEISENVPIVQEHKFWLNKWWIKCRAASSDFGQRICNHSVVFVKHVRLCQEEVL